MQAELHKSLDETIAAIREQHALEMRECKDRTLAAEVKAALLEDQLARATEARMAAERLSTKLVAQFGSVEAIFADAKALALAAYAPPPQADDERLPEVKP